MLWFSYCLGPFLGAFSLYLLFPLTVYTRGRQPKARVPTLARGGLIAGTQANAREVYVFHSDKVVYLHTDLHFDVIIPHSKKTRNAHVGNLVNYGRFTHIFFGVHVNQWVHSHREQEQRVSAQQERRVSSSEARVSPPSLFCLRCSRSIKVKAHIWWTK